jgi:hypothetical protein
MIIQKVIENSATMLDDQNVLDYLRGQTISEQAIKQTDKLVRLANLVITELTAMGFYTICTQKVEWAKGGFKIADLINNPIEILSVKDAFASEIDFEIKGDGISTNKIADTVTYAYFVGNLDLSSEMEFENKKITEQILALGVVAEYYLTLCDFDSACVYHDKYAEQLKKISKVKSSWIKGRVWA